MTLLLVSQSSDKIASVLSTALTEAKDICKFLKPLAKHFTTLEETDFSDVAPCLKPLMHVVCLVWANSRYYCNSGKIIILLKEICNLIIHQVWVYRETDGILIIILKAMKEFLSCFLGIDYDKVIHLECLKSLNPLVLAVCFVQ